MRLCILTSLSMMIRENKKNNLNTFSDISTQSEK